MKYRLYDQISAMLISEYDDKEDAVKEVGGIMSHFGPQHCLGRYVVTQKPDRAGQARIVYQPHELMNRAFVYFDQKVLNLRQEKIGKPGKWASL